LSRSDLAQTTCSVARTIERVGDTWTLMIVREMFLGSRRFDDLQRHTGASPHVLSQRLKHMQADGIIWARNYSERPPRQEYLLTDKGKDLWPVIVTLRAWGNKWLHEERDRPPTIITHKGCGEDTEPYLVCDKCGEPLHAHDCIGRIGPAMEAERQVR